MTKMAIRWRRLLDHHHRGAGCGAGRRDAVLPSGSEQDQAGTHEDPTTATSTCRSCPEIARALDLFLYGHDCVNGPIWTARPNIILFLPCTPRLRLHAHGILEDNEEHWPAYADSNIPGRAKRPSQRAPLTDLRRAHVFCPTEVNHSETPQIPMCIAPSRY